MAELAKGTPINQIEIPRTLLLIDSGHTIVNPQYAFKGDVTPKQSDYTGGSTPNSPKYDLEGNLCSPGVVPEFDLGNGASGSSSSHSSASASVTMFVASPSVASRPISSGSETQSASTSSTKESDLGDGFTQVKGKIVASTSARPTARLKT